MSCANMPSCMPPPYSATEQQGVQQPKSNIRKIPGNKFFAITTMIGGSLLVILGIIAIVVEAQMSYIGAPIWTGMLVSISFQNNLVVIACNVFTSVRYKPIH